MFKVDCGTTMILEQKKPYAGGNDARANFSPKELLLLIRDNNCSKKATEH